MNVPIVSGLECQSGGGKIACIAPESKTRKYAVLQPKLGNVAVISACPQ